MAVDQKILDKIGKLLRLAAPSSGTNEHERASAALTAAQLISEHDLEVRPKERPQPKRRARPRPVNQPAPWVRSSPPPPGWARSRAARDSICEDPDCCEPIHRGDVVWARIIGFETQYLHLGKDCGW